MTDPFYIDIESIISNLIFIDDYYKWQHKKGLIIDWSVLADKNRISDIVHSGQYLFGIEYTALRKEFWEIPKKIVAENIGNILLTFGGSDIRNSTIRMLRLLNDAYSNFRITVVVGESYNDVEEIRREAKGNVTLVYSPDARCMKESMLKTDVAIASGGQTLYELARTGVPTIAIVAADNQLGDVYGWESVGFLLNAGWWNHSNLEENVINFIETCFCKKRRQEMADIGQNLVDGQGARRIAQSIVENLQMIFKFEQRASVILYNFLAGVTKNQCFILPSNICPIVPAVYLKAGVPFEFIDIESSTLEMDEEVVLLKLKNNIDRYAGLHWAGTYGAEKRKESLFKEIKAIKPELSIIDDRCLQKPDFKPSKSTTDLIIYSTGYSKYVDINWGGFGLISDTYPSYTRHTMKYCPLDLDNLTQKFRQSIQKETPMLYQDTNWLGDTSFENDGFTDYRDEILQMLTIVENHKKSLNEIYRNHIPKEAQLASRFHNWRFNIVTNEKERLIKNIFSKGLFASSHYFPAAQIFNHPSCPNAEKLYRRVVNLFNDFRFNSEKAMILSNIVKKHTEKYGIK